MLPNCIKNKQTNTHRNKKKTTYSVRKLHLSLTWQHISRWGKKNTDDRIPWIPNVVHNSGSPSWAAELPKAGTVGTSFTDVKT